MATKREIGKPDYHWRFDSLEHWLKEAKPSPANREEYRSAMDRGAGAKDWFGCDGPDTVNKYIHEGWPGGLKRIAAMRAKMTQSIPLFRKARRRPYRSDQGDELDIHAVRSGNLDRAWRRMTKRHGRGSGKSRKVRVVMDIGGHAGCSADDLFWPPAASLALCGRLVHLGYAVEIVASFAVDGFVRKPHQTGVFECVVKSFDRPYNPESFAILALSGLFRTHGFGVLYSVERRTCYGLGHHVPAESVAHLFKRDDATVIITPSMRTERAAIKWLNDTLETQGRTDADNAADERRATG